MSPVLGPLLLSAALLLALSRPAFPPAVGGVGEDAPLAACVRACETASLSEGAPRVPLLPSSHQVRGDARTPLAQPWR